MYSTDIIHIKCWLFAEKKISRQPHQIPAFIASHNMYKTGTRRSGFLQTSIPRGATEKPRKVLQLDNISYRLCRLWVVVSGEWKTTRADACRSRKVLFPTWDWWWLPPAEIRSDILLTYLYFNRIQQCHLNALLVPQIFTFLCVA